MGTSDKTSNHIPYQTPLMQHGCSQGPLTPTKQCRVTETVYGPSYFGLPKDVCEALRRKLPHEGLGVGAEQLHEGNNN